MRGRPIIQIQIPFDLGAIYLTQLGSSIPVKLVQAETVSYALLSLTHVGVYILNFTAV